MARKSSSLAKKLSSSSIECPVSEERDNYLKGLFGNMTPRDITDYSIKHPGDLDLNEYITRFTSPGFNRELFELLPYSKK
ncbi:MAG: hypothetical protein WC979_08785 [Candidatus Pacearchaeota archaeon]|jgi:hypothetical protein